MADSEPAVYSAPVPPGLVATTAHGVRANAKLIALLSLGHFVVDLNQGSLPALLPFLKSAHQLSYAAVATIVLAANVASSIVQPLFGYFGDQRGGRAEGDRPLLVFAGRQRGDRAGTAGDHGARHRRRLDGKPRSPGPDPRRVGASARGAARVFAERGAPGGRRSRGTRRRHAARHGPADPGRHDSLVDDPRLHDV